MKAVLIVGLRTPSHVPRPWGDSFSARRLEWLLGVERGRLLEAADCINLLGPDERACAESLRAAADRVDVSGYEVLVLCGHQVWRGFGQPWVDKGPETPAVVRVRGVQTVLLPHPSGLTRNWNDPAVRARAQEVLRQVVVPHLPEGVLRGQSDEAKISARAVVRAKVWRDAVLEAIARIGVLRIAAEQAGISVASVLALRRRDPEFAGALSEARERFLDRAEAEVARRGIYGYDRPIYQGGVEVGKERVYSDQLLLRLLAAGRPERWSEQHRLMVEARARAARTIEEIDRLPTEELERIVSGELSVARERR
jgi:hypothetical protein